jgi:hypothetical protein
VKATLRLQRGGGSSLEVEWMDFEDNTKRREAKVRFRLPE